MKYNGWTNYETWRIALEVFDGYQTNPDFDSTDELENYLRDVAEDLVLSKVEENSLAHGLLVSFLSEVNFREIAENLTNN